MRIVCLADLHDEVLSLAKMESELSSADLVLLVGDITNFGGPDELTAVLNAVSAQCSTVYAVAGNCDPPAVHHALATTAFDIGQRTVSLAGVQFSGLGCSTPCPVGTPSEMTEDEYRVATHGLQFDASQLHVLVTHQPPFDTRVDLALVGKHVGSHAIREFIEQHQPALCVTGHIHEGVGIDRVGDSLVMNPGAFREGRYAIVKISENSIDVDLRQLVL